MIMPFCWKMYFLNYFYVLFKFEIIEAIKNSKNMTPKKLKKYNLI